MRGSDVIIIQRVIPHYRVPLFRRLYRRFGIRVATAARPAGGTFLKTVDPRDLEFAIPTQIEFPEPNNEFRAEIPVGWILEQLSPKCIVAEFSMHMSSTYALPFTRLNGRIERLVFWTHGWQMGRGFDNFQDVAAQLSRLPLYAAADAIATYSESGARWVKGWLPWKKVVSLGNTLDETETREASIGAEPLRSGRPQFISVGRLTRDKGFDIVIAAFLQIHERLPGASLTIIGDGPDRQRLEALAGPQLGHAIKFPGAIFDEHKIAPHFLGADLYILGGAAGLSVNHALTYGVPVVAFSRGRKGPLHHPEIDYVVEGQTGFLVPKFDAAAMANAVLEIVSSDRIALIKSRLPAYVRSNMSIDTMVDNFGVLLQSI